VIMDRTLRSPAFAMALLVIAASSARAASTPYNAFYAAVSRSLKAHSPSDWDGDGVAEIWRLRKVYVLEGRDRGAVVVFVEHRLLQTPTESALEDLRPSIKTFAEDLAQEGYHVAVLETDLYRGSQHEDGLIVLALRQVLRDIWRRVPDLRAVVFVGDFPTAFIVRQYYWPREDSLVLFPATPYEKKWEAVRHVRSIAEPVASPADIVLADLDGHWDRLYHRGPERLSGLLAAFPDDPKREVTDTYQHTSERYEDFFLVQDGFWEEQVLQGGKRRFVFPGEPDHECADADRRQVNVLARPEIAIGRINARHVALEPDLTIQGIHGERLLDANGRPQTVEFADEQSVPSAERLWVRSEQLERRLLKEYFDRNHRYRRGGFSYAWHPASITTEWSSSVPDMKASVPGWRNSAVTGLDVRGANVSALDFVLWLQKPALVRAIKAHSGPTGFGFEPPASMNVFAAVVGPYWWWHREGRRLVPSPIPHGGWIHYGVLRALYENRRLSGAPAFYFHTGCEAITPLNYQTEPYHSPRHGLWQIAETLLMLGDGLALVGRGKVFYDEPREFWKVMGAGETFGEAWKHYFEVEGADAELAKDGIGRKRAYFWSVIGDCTLRLPAALVAPGPEEQK